jgi:hypothetical protein
MSTTISHVPISGGNATVLVGSLTKPFNVVVDSTYLYWTDANGIWKISKGGGKIVQLAASVDAEGIAIDDASLYFTDYSFGRVRKITPK